MLILILLVFKELLKFICCYIFNIKLVIFKFSCHNQIMSITPEELIRKVRAAKTPAQETAIIDTELSAIRSSFKLKD